MMSRGGRRKGAGRKPRADRKTVKTVQFAGQRWEPAQVAAWKAYMTCRNLTAKEFARQAFDALLRAEEESQ